MTDNIDPQTITAQARELLEQRNAKRIATVQQLAQARAKRDEQRVATATAEAEDAAAYAAAVKGGWTADDLASMGLEDPDRKPGARPRRTRRSRSAAAPASPAAVPANGGPGARDGASTAAADRAAN